MAWGKPNNRLPGSTPEWWQYWSFSHQHWRVHSIDGSSREQPSGCGDFVDEPNHPGMDLNVQNYCTTTPGSAPTFRVEACDW